METNKVSVSSRVFGWIAAGIAGILGLLFFTWMKKGAAEAKNEISDAKLQDAKAESEHQNTQAKIEQIKAELTPKKLENGAELSDFFNNRYKK